LDFIGYVADTYGTVMSRRLSIPAFDELAGPERESISAVSVSYFSGLTASRLITPAIGA
jgi:hypothetical protein